MRTAASSVALALALSCALAPHAGAQERIVVTGARIAERLGGGYVIPHVGVTRRADYLLRTLYVSCDTRDAVMRAQELSATLRGMLAEAEQDDSIELSRLVTISAEGGSGYGYDEDADVIVAPFTEEAIETDVRPNYAGRTDTSYIQLQVKTSIRADDTLEAAVARIEEFVDRVERVGRSTLDLDESDVLSIVDPQQYRDEVFAAMAADANERLAELGDGYAARFEGLENQVTWFRSDVLDLRLFIPHRLAITPDGR